MPVIRDRRHQNFESIYVFKDKYFPPYCSGRGYLFRFDVLPCFINISTKFKLLNNEDSFTGIVAKECNIQPVVHKGYNFQAIYNNNIEKALDNIWKFQDKFFIHGMKPFNHLIMESILNY